MSVPEPSRAAILDFIEEERAAGREVGRREIARAFGLDQGGKIWLKRLLREMEQEGEIGGDGKERPVHPHEALPPVLLSASAPARAGGSADEGACEAGRGRARGRAPCVSNCSPPAGL
ncbi:hypothetical protein BTHI11S_04631 [Bosea thiooxidans]